MRNSYCGRRGLIAGMFLGAVLPARAVDSQAVIAPIQQLVTGLRAIMKAGPQTPFPRRFDILAPVIDRSFDLAAILQKSIGPSWQSFPPDQQEMLTRAFRRYTVASYVNNFDNDDGQRLLVEPGTRDVGDEQVVRTRLIPLSGEARTLDYLMRQGPSGWQVVDVLVDGAISRVAVQRSDFRRLLARGGAQGLADSLRTKFTDLSGGST